ncbi:MAG: hypothetical protein ABSC00_02460 [Acidimicrobiales bacterium]
MATGWTQITGTDLPVALVIIPVGHAAPHDGLTGSAATGLWATVLWRPALLSTRDQDLLGVDLVVLVLVDVVASFVGARIESERVAHERGGLATSRRVPIARTLCVSLHFS